MINFLKLRTFNLFLSLSFVAASVAVWYARGVNYSVDFDGGTQMVFSFTNAVTDDQIKGALISGGLSGVITRAFSDKEVLVRVKEFAADAKGQAERVRTVLEAGIPGNSVHVVSVDSVGPAAGENLRTKAIYSIIVGMLLMLLYVTVRFEFSFALGAVACLFHDALAIVGTFIFMGMEISPNVIVALLTVLGYSMNDTIVIFTRIRENMGKMVLSTLDEIVNVSINQTLTRTLLTSLATSLSVLAFLFLGGESLRDLSLSLLIGIVVGTYSSIYIASPVMMLLHRRK